LKVNLDCQARELAELEMGFFAFVRSAKRLKRERGKPRKRQFLTKVEALSKRNEAVRKWCGGRCVLSGGRFGWDLPMCGLCLSRNVEAQRTRVGGRTLPGGRRAGRRRRTPHCASCDVGGCRGCRRWQCAASSR
jgi:hypothetical protein